MEKLTSKPNLCYIDADRVESDAGRLNRLDVRDTANRRLGELDGFIVDPTARRLRYFVIGARHWLRRHRYVVPLCPAALDSEHHALRIDPEPSTLAACRDFDPEIYRTFSDEDAVAALHGDRHAA